MPLDKELTRTAVGNGKRLEVQQINTKEILLLGKDPGNTTLMLWFTDGTFREESVNIRRDLSVLEAAIASISSGIRVEGAPDRDAVILLGRVPDARFSRAAEDIAAKYMNARRDRKIDVEFTGMPAAPTKSPVAAAGSQPPADNAAATPETVRAQGEAPNEASVINLIAVDTLPPRLEDRLLEIARTIGGEGVSVRRVVRGTLPDDTRDVFVFDGAIADQVALVRLLTVAAQLVRGQNLAQARGGAAQNFDPGIHVVADEAGGVQPASATSGTTNTSSGSLGNFGSNLNGVGLTNGTGNLANLVHRNVARAKVLEAAGGRLLSFLEVKDLPQVRVSIELYEINRSKLRTFSIDFASPSANFKLPPFTPSPLAQSLQGAGAVPVGSVSKIDLLNILSFLNNGLGDEFSAVGRHIAVTAALSMLESEGIARDLSRPTLTVLSGELANFQAGGAVPIPQSFAPAFGGSTSSPAGVFNGVSFQNFGVQLGVRPLVGQDDSVTLDVSPSVVTPDASLTATVRDSTGNNQATLSFKTRSMQTSTRLQDGQALILGGLMTSDVSQNAQFAPFLNKIPVLEYFFKKTQSTDDELELVIVVNPTIVREPNRAATLWEFPDPKELMKESTGPNRPR
jgi:Flp pilus assembly secretin CpaC